MTPSFSVGVGPHTRDQSPQATLTRLKERVTVLLGRTHSRIAKVDELPLHTPARAADIEKLPVNHLPRAFARAPTTTNPAADSPTPPARYLGVVEFRIPFELARKRVSNPNEVGVSGVKVALMDWKFSVGGNGFGVLGDGPPEVAHEAVQVVHRFDLRRMRTTEQNSSRAKERLNVVRHVSEPLPDDGCDAGFAAETTGMAR